jgi:ABC-type branched-subunit amino acid transport system substrate-binding protein
MSDIDLKAALRGEPGPSLVRVVTGLGVAAFGLWLVAIIGYYSVKHDNSTNVAADSGDSTITTQTTAPGGPVTSIDPNTGQTVLIDPSTGQTIPSGSGSATTRPGATGTTAPGTATTKPGGTATTVAPNTGGPGDRTGVTAKEIKWAVHAPVTLNGAPWGLADDPLKGVDTYLKVINEQGGVNGRTVVYKVFDDRYTVDGANTASNAAVNDYKPFFLSGTLGVDQVAVFALEAKKRGVPYIAAGGSEKSFKDIGMYQSAASYDTHLIQLANFLGKETNDSSSPYFNRKKIGVVELDSEYIKPSVDAFRDALQAKGLTLVKRVTVKKPTEQTTYATQEQELAGAGVQTLVPAMDPISTSRMVSECKPATQDTPTPACPWRWTFSDFAHDSDTVLALMGAGWSNLRGLSGGCYYQAPMRAEPAKCGRLGTAHDQWVAKNGEQDWTDNGSGGAAGYQIVHFWLKALKDAGTDPTRERFRAALSAYQGYDDLISSPITFKGSPNLSHGAEKMTVLLAGANVKYSQLSPGFVNSF